MNTRVFQCLLQNVQTNLGVSVDLEANGIKLYPTNGLCGPFRYTDVAELESVTPERAYRTP